ncbi:MAG TPA: ABC transporter ATP-binding protein [Actinomycetota bacterium]|jgi:ABC-2 type transport system ATP-binding protein
MRNAPAYEVRNLQKVYKSPPVVANDGITFVVEPGEVFGLLGPNGAGKTTLVRQLVGLLRPTAGDLRLFGEHIGRSTDRRIGRTVAYLPQGALSLGELRVEEAIRWTGTLRGATESVAINETAELLDVLTIRTIADRQVRKLSGGQRRLVQIAMTLVARLPILVLDEPTTDVDPALRQRIWDLLIQRARAGAAVVLVTHDVAEAEHALERVAILAKGKVIAQGRPAELKAGLSHRTRIEIVVGESSPLSLTALAADLDPDARITGRRVSAWVPADEAMRRLEKITTVAGEGGLEDVRLVTPTLEDVYLDLHGRMLDEDDDE